MLNTMTLSVPKKFDFEKTARILQRGLDDPINRFEDKTWTRHFMIDECDTVLSIRHDKKLHVNVIVGGTSEKSVKAAVLNSVGLDDPLLREYDLDVRNKEKLAAFWHIAVPGYPSVYEAIIQTIFGQLVSVAVANIQRKKFVEKFGRDFVHDSITYRKFPSVEDIACVKLDDLRALGFGGTKSRAILEVSQKFVNEGLGQALIQTNDRQVINELLDPIYGIGRWTIDWVALRALRHFDVIPAGDLAVRHAFTWWLNKKELMSVGAVDKFYKKLYPYGGALTYRILCAYTAFKNQQTTILI